MNTNVPLQIKNKITGYSKEYNGKSYLQRFQYIVQQYIIESQQRGLLVFHGTGTGKSILAASLIDHYRNEDPTRKIVAILPKSLQKNLEGNISKYISANSKIDLPEKAVEEIRFIGLNASNMFEQVTRIDKSEEQIKFEKRLTNLNEYIGVHKDFLENSLVIIDESHHFSNSVTNGSKNAVKLYETLMKTKNIKIIFLTATPIINGPFELAPVFNILRGPIYANGKKYELFPENKLDFDELFIDAKNATIKNKTKFQNRIYGFVSYYGDYFLEEGQKKKDFPEQYPTIIEKVPMSSLQKQRYEEIRKIEEKEEKRRFGRNTAGQKFAIKEKTKDVYSYRVRSRQICNYCVPKYAIDSQDRVSKIKKEDLLNLSEYSPKFEKIIENIKKRKSQLGIVYSEFVMGEGLGLFAKTLGALGYQQWEGSNVEDAIGNKTYAIISGEVPLVKRQGILSVFNDETNTKGEIISLLLISKTGAEGINVKNVRHIHIMEPFWNHARIEQIIGRGVRYKSHIALPANERNVQPYIYLSCLLPSELGKKEETTDEYIYRMSLLNAKIRADFEEAMIEVSIDCHENVKKRHGCRLCAPTNEPLYSHDIYQDIDREDPCETFKEKSLSELNAKEIIVDGKKYYYTIEGILPSTKIYRFDETMQGYIPLEKNNPIYADISRRFI